MFETRDQAVYELLRDRALIDETQLNEWRSEQPLTGRALADLAVESGAITTSALLSAVAEAIGGEYRSELPEVIGPELLKVLTPDQARSYGAIALSADAQRVEIAALDPFNGKLVEDLTFVCGRDIRLIVAEPAKIEALIKRCYGDDEASLEGLASELLVSGAGDVDGTLSVDDLETLARQTPVIRLVNLILGQAIRDHASDIHFEPFEQEFKVRYRIDGALYETTPPPKRLALPITSRLKVLANLNIAERRIPQDGRMRLTISGRAVDLRVSTLPTQFGESVVLRVLDQSAVQLKIGDLGLPANILAGVEDMVRRPNGIFIVTGPTGSGKTTTLYSALRVINTPDLKVLTAEDPVEYEVEGLIQVPVLPSVGLTFSATLRSFLRQDPDVIMIGEIRDLETAQIAVQASLTGHLVLSTLHTNDAAGAVTRLSDMGIEPFLIASSLEAVLAQRLVRRVCRRCAKETTLSESQAVRIGAGCEHVGRSIFCRGAGCSDCGNTGYRGRSGIYEWLQVSEAIRERVTKRAPTLDLRQLARSAGMQTLRESGIEAVLSRITTLDEVMACT